MKVIRILVVVSLFMLLSVTVLNANSDTARTIFVTIDGERQQHRTTAETIAEFFESAEIEIHEGDTINVELTDLVISARGVRNAPSREIIIYRGISVTVNYETYSREIGLPQGSTGNDLALILSRERERVYTFDGDRNQLLESGGEYNLLVTVSGRVLGPKSDSRVFDESTYVMQYTEIPYEIEIRPTFNMSSGEEKIIREGIIGQNAVLFRVSYGIGDSDDVEQQKDAIHKNVIVEMVPKIVERGIAGTRAYDISSLDIVRTIEMNATAYTAGFESTGRHPGDPLFGITASGMRVRPGIVAVDPRVIPLGTRLYVEGYGFAIAADTGGAIRGNKIDLFFETVADALAFGRRDLIVHVLADDE
ncbi:MAG: 3D domain-containing protein [Defluviitaleaceae bacterium]|nr:3D domain-containing protein [Defluviitaleaceae bacterium]